MIPPWNWNEFMEELKQQLPDFDRRHIPKGNQDFNWIEDYVRQSLHKALGMDQEKAQTQSSRQKKQPDQNVSQPMRNVHHEVIELHKLIIVKLTLPQGLNPRRLRLSIHPYQLKWRILPDSQYKKIPLPAAVQTSGAKAICVKGIMEIRMPKSAREEHFEELNPIFRD